MGDLKYKVGDKVRIKSIDWYNENKDAYGHITFCREDEEDVIFDTLHSEYCGEILTIEAIVYDTRYLMIPDIHMSEWTDEMIEGLVEEEEIEFTEEDKYWCDLMSESDSTKDMGEVSDGYHTFNELYEYRLLYNASMFNELAKQNLYDVHKSKRHSDGEIPFGDPNWFIVMAELPTGQISNHYEMKDWDLFDIPEKETANKWDGHTPKDVTERLRRFLTPKSKYPQTYEECCKVLGYSGNYNMILTTDVDNKLFNALYRLKVCRDAYWKLYGEEMGLGKPWEPDWNNPYTTKWTIVTGEKVRIVRGNTRSYHSTFAFPTEEIRDAFYETFNDLIESCKELL